jgi:hypothetical protein
MINPIRYTNMKPAVKKENRFLKAGPRSAKASISNPSASFSVIMLLPKAEFNEPLKGYIKTITRINIENQTIKTPFRDFNARVKPDFRELNIFILIIITVI